MLKFQAVAEKTAKNFRVLLFCRTLYITRDQLWIKSLSLGLHLSQGAGFQIGLLEPARCLLDRVNIL